MTEGEATQQRIAKDLVRRLLEAMCEIDVACVVCASFVELRETAVIGVYGIQSNVDPTDAMKIIIESAIILKEDPGVALPPEIIRKK
jgi:hypothetical protein